MEPEFVGKTFDDFLFRPQLGVVASRSRVDLSSRLSSHYDISLPILSANMDSVTGSAMAKTMALEGGVGIIHRAMSIDDQAREVSLVKRSHGYIVEKPFCLRRGATIREARVFIRKHNITGATIAGGHGATAKQADIAQALAMN